MYARKAKVLVVLLTVLSLVFSGFIVNAQGIIDFIGNPEAVIDKSSPVPGQKDFRDGNGNVFPETSDWYKWDVEGVGEAIKDGQVYRFTYAPAPDCDPQELFIYAKAGKYMMGTNVSPGERVVIDTVYFEVYFESATTTSWKFVVSGMTTANGIGTPHGLSNWGFLCKPNGDPPVLPPVDPPVPPVDPPVLPPVDPPVLPPVDPPVPPVDPPVPPVDPPVPPVDPPVPPVDPPVPPVDPPVPPVDPPTEIVLEPEQPEVGDDEGQDENIVVELEQPGVGGGELPQTSGADLLLFGFGLVVTTGGLLIRRRSK